MNSIRCWQVDAFTDQPFHGNPAAVYWLDSPRETRWMQAVAAEMNLSETAFVRPRGDVLELRWFTPTMEVDLCGHATLATAHALWSDGLFRTDQPLGFQTRSGLLTCFRAGDFIELNFPATPAKMIQPTENLLGALGIESALVAVSKFYLLVVVDSAETVRNLQPDFGRLIQEKTLGVIVTALSDEPQFDFISRFFAPAMGVNEDPVCGSAHCCLTPYWAERLGKSNLTAYQASPRGGLLKLRLTGDRVVLAGQAVTVWKGECYC